MKRYIDSRKKEYLEFVKQNDSQAANGGRSAIEVKQTATRITIEGEHVCLFLIRRVNTPSVPETTDAATATAAQQSAMHEIEITPILNAPYQLAQVTIPLQDLKVALTYRYMYERRAIRLVTRSENKEYIINFKNQRHKERALKCITRLAAPYLD